jgi:signal transduction histidine kinase
VNVTGKDELSGLASNINRMLEALEAAQADVRVAKEIAERANQAKSMFIARVSHELRTPVAGIIGLNDMLLKRVGDQRGVRELLNMQGVSAEGLLTIINEILDFSTIEQGKLTFENIEFEPRTVAKEAMQVVTGRLLVRPANAPLQLVIDVAPTVARKLKGDPTKLKQILVNLIGNGIKFTQRGNVGLKLDCTKNESGKQWLQFSVWDTGIGIPASKLATVFEPFTQADESVRRKYQGTGLGLTIVKQMAEGMGGAVSVESVEGSGSTFKVTIPFEAASAAPYDVSGESTGRGIWPTSFTVIGESCRVRDSVVEGLSLFGGKSNGVFEHVNHENAKAIKDSKLIVLLEDAAQSLEGQKLIKEKAAHGVIVPVISLAQGELRQKLHTDGVRTILSYPVLADDIVSALITERMVSYQDAAASIVRSLPTCSRPLRILVADDTLTNRIVLEDLLTEAGHSVVCVDDGQKLVERLRPMLTGENDAEGFDIVLTDISMPTMDGYSATKEIRALEKDSGHHIPIVAITAHILTEEQAKMKASGMDEVLTKPIKPEAVAAVFETLVKD